MGNFDLECAIGLVRCTKMVVGFNRGVLLGSSIESFLSELASSEKKTQLSLKSIRMISTTLDGLMNIVFLLVWS